MKLFAPLINDISTDKDEPPKLYDQQSYPIKNWSVQKKHYPKVKPFLVNAGPSEVFSKVENLARLQEGWDDFHISKDDLRINAVATTPVLKFRDDIALEVRQLEEDLTAVHMRSRSRTGKSDFGKNAERIEDFFSQLKLLFDPITQNQSPRK